MDGRNIYVEPFVKPVLYGIVSSAGASAPFFFGDALIILGDSLSGDDMVVKIGNTEIMPNFQSIKRDRIEIRLSDPSISAGICAVQAICRVYMGNPKALRNGPSSNILSFKLSPKIAVSFDDKKKEIILNVEPSIKKTQKLRLLLNKIRTEGSADSYNIKIPSREEDTKVLNVSIPDIASGKYLVRLEVDGALSPLDMENGIYAKPSIEV